MEASKKENWIKKPLSGSCSAIGSSSNSRNQTVGSASGPSSVHGSDRKKGAGAVRVVDVQVL